MVYDDYDPDDPDGVLPVDLEADDASDDADDTTPCPACGALLPWDVPRCYACGTWFPQGSAGSTAAGRARGWFWPVMVAVLVAVILVMWHGL